MDIKLNGLNLIAIIDPQSHFFRLTRIISHIPWPDPMEPEARRWLKGKIHIRRLSKIEPGTGETLSLDLLIVTPEIKSAWDSRTKVEWEHGDISVVSPEGLILLKSFRRSGQDQDDINFLRSITDEG